MLVGIDGSAGASSDYRIRRRHEAPLSVASPAAAVVISVRTATSPSVKQSRAIAVT
jgi:hypothetical protein